MGVLKTAVWMSNRWRSGCAFIYCIICVFDVIIVPSWIGLNRLPLEDLVYLLEGVDDVALKRELAHAATRQHELFTLQGSGLFHLSFGAILTGAAVNRLSHKPQTRPD